MRVKKKEIIKKNKKVHFKRRLKERYGIECNSKIIGKITEIIQTFECEYYYKGSCSRLFCLLDFCGRILYLVYDCKRHIPLTALPLNNFFDIWRIK